MISFLVSICKVDLFAWLLSKISWWKDCDVRDTSWFHWYYLLLFFFKPGWLMLFAVNRRVTFSLSVPANGCF